MTVVVVQTDRDDRNLGMHRSEERRHRIRRTVMRHLEYVGADVDMAVEHRLLRLDLGVRPEQDAHPAHGRARDQRRVVRVGVCGVECTGRTEYFEMDRADVEGLPGLRLFERKTVRGERVLHEMHAGHRLEQRPGDDPSDVAAMEHTRHPRHVIEVHVRQDEQRHRVHAEVVQAAVHQHRVRATIHDHGLARTGIENQPVALPDIASHEEPAVGRPRRYDRPNRKLDQDADDERDAEHAAGAR